MGKRRARDLLLLGHRVVGFDLRPERNAEARQRFGIPTVTSFVDLLGSGVEAVVISTPPDQHLPYYELCFEHRLPFFTEANIFTPRADWFAERERTSGVRGYASATWRFYPLFQMLKDRLQEIGLEQVNSVHSHYGGYLPFWHPWERYTAFYAGQMRTSAAREMVPFELQWICWVFGPMGSVCALQDRRFPWATDMDDTYLLLLEFDSGLRGTLNVELHQVAPFRLGRVACREDSFTLKLDTHELLWYSQKTDAWRHLKPPGMRALGSFDFEEVYRAEILRFGQALSGEAEFPNTWEDERHLSSILFAAEESWRRKSWVTIKEAEELYDGLSWVRE